MILPALRANPSVLVKMVLVKIQQELQQASDKLNVLARVWRGTFSKSPILDFQAMDQLCNGVAPWDFQQFRDPDERTYDLVLSRVKNSAAGVAGLPYEAWKKGRSHGYTYIVFNRSVAFSW